MEKILKTVASSLLSADFSNLQDGISFIEKAQADWVHFDVMDGSFVPPITFGAKMLEDLRPLTKLPFDVHLMVNNPEDKIETFASAGADLITVHYETSIHLHRILTKIQSLGKKAGVSIVPSQPVESLSAILDMVDLVLIMSVNPGYGGQSFIPSSLTKIDWLVQERERRGLNYKISIDGGVNLLNCDSIFQRGADVLVSGSAFFDSQNPIQFVKRLKGE